MVQRAMSRRGLSKEGDNLQASLIVLRRCAEDASVFMTDRWYRLSRGKPLSAADCDVRRGAVLADLSALKVVLPDDLDRYAQRVLAMPVPMEAQSRLLCEEVFADMQQRASVWFLPGRDVDRGVVTHFLQRAALLMVEAVLERAVDLVVGQRVDLVMAKALVEAPRSSDYLAERVMYDAEIVDPIGSLREADRMILAGQAKKQRVRRRENSSKSMKRRRAVRAAKPVDNSPRLPLER